MTRYKNCLNSTDPILIKLQPVNYQTNILKNNFRTENLQSAKVNFSIKFKEVLAA